MQTFGPYRLLDALGTCQVGGVWSAVGPTGSRLTLAVLNPDAARNPGWRNAFADAANRLGQSGQVPIITGDFTAAAPWVASSAVDGAVVATIFTTLGMTYQPAASPGDTADVTQPVILVTPPGSPVTPPGSPALPTTPPAAAEAVDPAPAPSAPPPAAVPQQPYPAGPYPAGPYPPAAGGLPPADETPPRGFPAVPAQSPWAQPPSPPRRRRGLLLVGVAVLVVVVLGGAGVAVAIALRPDQEPGPITPPPVATSVAPSAAQPTAPGVEPPQEGEWPGDWPTFEAGDATAANLPGVDFGFQLPAGWSCTNVETTEDQVHYTCGPDGVGGQIGGDLVVRTCPDPCDADRRVEMRRTQEAWGLPWVRDGGYRCWAETDSVNGEARYGLVFVGYRRTTEEGRIDQQVVFRLTAPVDDADDIRKVANSIRDGALGG